jgi:hypothetical protein
MVTASQVSSKVCGADAPAASRYGPHWWSGKGCARTRRLVRRDESRAGRGHRVPQHSGALRPAPRGPAPARAPGGAGRGAANCCELDSSAAVTSSASSSAARGASERLRFLPARARGAVGRAWRGARRQTGTLAPVTLLRSERLGRSRCCHRTGCGEEGRRACARRRRPGLEQGGCGTGNREGLLLRPGRHGSAAAPSQSRSSTARGKSDLCAAVRADAVVYPERLDEVDGDVALRARCSKPHLLLRVGCAGGWDT